MHRVLVLTAETREELEMLRKWEQTKVKRGLRVSMNKKQNDGDWKEDVR